MIDDNPMRRHFQTVPIEPKKPEPPRWAKITVLTVFLALLILICSPLAGWATHLFLNFWYWGWGWLG